MGFRVLSSTITALVVSIHPKGDHPIEKIYIRLPPDHPALPVDAMGGEGFWGTLSTYKRPTRSVINAWLSWSSGHPVIYSGSGEAHRSDMWFRTYG